MPDNVSYLEIYITPLCLRDFIIPMSLLSVLLRYFTYTVSGGGNTG